MTKHLILTALIATLLSSTGCGFFSKKSGQPKESSAIASEVEETFRKRWVDKRMSELTATGVTADVARTQADAEFREKYGFSAAKKK